MKKFLILVVGILILLLMTSCGAGQAKAVSRASFMLDTYLEITIYDWEDEEILTAAMQEISRLEQLLSVEKEGSDLYRLTEAAGRDWVEISPECEEVLRLSKEICQRAGGHFDVTSGPLIDLWAIRDGAGHYPTEGERQAAIAKLSSEKMLVEEGRAFLTESGMKANLGAIAKGYIADKVKELLLSEGVEHAVIFLGGNVLLIGDKASDTGFSVGVKSPFDASKIIATLKLTDKSAVTSGVDERFFEYEGVRYHHILDPFTGFPADTGVASVTIISEQSVMGDALSTTCLLLGVEQGLALIETMPDVEALFLMQNRASYQSSGFAQYLSES